MKTVFLFCFASLRLDEGCSSGNGNMWPRRSVRGYFLIDDNRQGRYLFVLGKLRNNIKR